MSGSKIIEGLRDAVAGNLSRVSFFEGGQRQVWTRHDVDSPEGHLAQARDALADALTEIDMLKAHIAQLEDK